MGHKGEGQREGQRVGHKGEGQRHKGKGHKSAVTGKLHCVCHAHRCLQSGRRGGCRSSEGGR